MANSILTLLNSSYDSFSNLYSVVINPPSGVTGLDGDIRILNFQPPTLALGEYATHYKTVSLPRFNAQITGEREFTLKFRVDADWTIYNSLKSWRDKFVKLSADQINFGMHNNLTTNSTNYGRIVVKAMKATPTGLADSGVEDANKIEWTFKQVILYDLVDPVFNRESSTPIEITAKFLFGEFEPPVFDGPQAVTGAV